VQPRSNLYVLRFTAVVCVVCAVLVSASAVLLHERQLVNVELDRKRNVLVAAGALGSDETVSQEEIERRFASFDVVAVDLRTGEEDGSFDISGYDARRVLADPDTSRAVPRNAAQVQRVPSRALVYKRLDRDGRTDLLVLPVSGQGLWAAMYGFLALGPDMKTIRGLTYYEHGETPGLGAEVNSPRWQALWPGRQAFDEQGSLVIEVIRGRAGPVAGDPHRVDGLAGATITSTAVTSMLQFWLGDDGFGRYLERLTTISGDGSDG
jgi:Na+-transporting NADH:ubiquinone oxidoreductase subunit C